ncbi:purine-cytosine permease family protein [Flavobacterium muglaense]|uniref:Cytosine permease n=1 Tax=Flavobacterium muglaense TaxID=2764716 RepID=A0A923SF74_9FLAO|nr:cytosine permease [Flavobacterium muglaense]MBC5837719.1 cytosine permease [Flavobacterium muglaense]MBC5844165.1 cytosine permease [Flavobacterium muglaense]
MEENNQYTTTKVEAKDFTSGWLVALIIAGTGLTLPILYLGSELALAVGFKNALWAFAISTLVLTVLCLTTTLIGNRSRLSTYMILHFSFGRKGAKIMNFIFGITLLGWFSVSLELLATAIKDTAFKTFQISLIEWPIIVLMGALTIITTLYGIKSIEKLANYAVPILTLFLGYVVYKSMIGTSFQEIVEFMSQKTAMSLFEATSILIGSSILFPVLMADFSRFIYNDKQSLIAVLGITIGFPIALLFSAIPSIQTGEVDIIKIMERLDLVLPAFLLLFVSTWVGNTSNLYSTTLTFSTVKTGWTFRKMAISAGILGTLAALIGVSTYLFEFLSFLGVLAPSISAIYIINFFWVKKQDYNLDEITDWEAEALIAWVLSSIVTVGTYYNFFQLTHAYFIDSFLLGAIIYLIFKWKVIFK